MPMPEFSMRWTTTPVHIGELAKAMPARPAPADIKLLQGPAAARARDSAAPFAIFREIVYGFRKLHFVGPCVTVFGSARFDQHHRYYAMAREVGQLLAKSGFTVMTGGGPGIMEAANRGAKDVEGRSLGCNIVLAEGAEAERVSSIRGLSSSTSSSAS